MEKPVADVLVTGGSGQVGLELQRVAGEGIRLVAPGRDELDLAKPDSIAPIVQSRPWSAVINAGAFTAVDRAESAVADAWEANALGPAILAAETARAGIPIVHVSTDYVFAGDKQGWYQEDDAVDPLGVYGASKLGGELAVRTANPRHAIVRTAWVISPHRTNFVKTMLRLASEHRRVRVVDDQQGCPTSASDLAAALLKVALRLAADPLARVGTYHFVGEGSTTWCGLARETFALSRARGGPWAEVDAITTAEYPTPARRPANSRLATAKIAQDFGPELRPWPAALADILDTLLPSTLTRAGAAS